MRRSTNSRIGEVGDDVIGPLEIDGLEDGSEGFLRRGLGEALRIGLDAKPLGRRVVGADHDGNQEQENGEKAPHLHPPCVAQGANGYDCTRRGCDRSGQSRRGERLPAENPAEDAAAARARRVRGRRFGLCGCGLAGAPAGPRIHFLLPPLQGGQAIAQGAVACGQVQLMADFVLEALQLGPLPRSSRARATFALPFAPSAP